MKPLRDVVVPHEMEKRNGHRSTEGVGMEIGISVIHGTGAGLAWTPELPWVWLGIYYRLYPNH